MKERYILYDLTEERTIKRAYYYSDIVKAEKEYKTLFKNSKLVTMKYIKEINGYELIN